MSQDNQDLRYCQHEGEYTWIEYDARAIPLCKVCEMCVDDQLARYRPEILSGYTQADVDEPIEEDLWFPENADI